MVKQKIFSKLKNDVLIKLLGDSSLKLDSYGIRKVADHTQLGERTIRRVFQGNEQLSANYFPTTHTLNRFAQFLGFSDWYEYLQTAKIKDSTDIKGYNSIPKAEQKLNLEIENLKIKNLILKFDLVQKLRTYQQDHAVLEEQKNGDGIIISNKVIQSALNFLKDPDQKQIFSK